MNWTDGWAKQRIITIFSDVTNDCARDTISQMWGLAALSNEPISLLLNTPGGEVPHAMAIVQAMKACPVPVNTIAIGRVYSAGLIVMVAGKNRTAFPDTLFMAHEFHNTRQTSASYRSLKRARVADDWTYKKLLIHFQVHTGLSRERVKKELLSSEYYFDQTIAVDLGIIDEIIQDKIKIERIEQ